MHITAGLRISRAFILGAGLGTRLRPLTGILPKPLIPFFHEPLILHSMRRCYDCGIRSSSSTPTIWRQPGTKCSLNIHGTAAPFISAMNPCCWIPGGGVKKIEPLASAEEPLLVVNGDMAATFDLGRLLEEHLSRRPPVTLALRTSGDKKNVGFDFSSGLVTDMRHALGRDPGSCQFTGAYCMEPEIFGRIPSGEAVSIIPLFLDYIREGCLRGILADDRVVDGHGNTGNLPSSPSGFPIPRSTHPPPGQSVPPRLCGQPLRDRPRSCGRGRLPPARLRCLGRAYACLPALARNAGFSIVPPPITDDAFSAPASPDIVLFRPGSRRTPRFHQEGRIFVHAGQAERVFFPF